MLSLVVIAIGSPLHADSINTLFEESCLDCHDDIAKKGRLSVEALTPQITPDNAAVWQNILEQVERGFMPPAGKRRPSREIMDAAIRELEDKLVNFHRKHADDHATVLRRLNRTEYRNTIRDLFHLELGSDPTRDFPGEQRSHGFASDGEKLVTSGFLLRQYLEVAEQIVDQAIHFEPKPDVQQWKMKPPFDRTTGAEIGQAVNYFKKTGQPQPYQDICERIGAGGAPYAWYHPLDDVSDSGVPVSGWYSVKIYVEAKFRHALKYKYFTRWNPLWDGTEPIRLSLFTATLQGIDPADKEARKFAATHEQADQRHVATWDLPDDKKIWLEAKVWLEKGQFPRLGFPNGPSNSNHRMLKYFNDLANDTLNEEELAEFNDRQKRYGGWIAFHFGESPRIRLYDIQMQGPLNETWPPKSHRVVFGDSSYESGMAREVLHRFAMRAWRRPVDAGELSALVELVRSAESKGLSRELAIQEGVKAVLCSPEFLYREEREKKLNDYEIASRLSYFFWSSMPDEALLQDAAEGKLQDAANRREIAERLLADPRSDAFVNEFLDGWLQLRKLGSMAPDPHRFRVYYDDRLEPAMRTETRLFFRNLLNTNGPVADFIDSDYTFANAKLAKFYGIKPDESKSTANADVRLRSLRQDGVGDSPTTRFTRVALNDRRRGGLLGQAAILTLTANGVDTSPVIRGVWLLENILGTPPPTPPQDVPAIEPDIRGAKSIREQLQKHRDSAACRSCHAHIDPPGFALESFDPIGGWRGHYRMGKEYVKIDPTGRFNGERFADIVGFKKVLMNRQDAFARNLVERLLMHLLGRELQVTDRPTIQRILAVTRPEGYRLRDLVLAVVESSLLQAK